MSLLRDVCIGLGFLCLIALAAVIAYVLWTLLWGGYVQPKIDERLRTRRAIEQLLRDTPARRAKVSP